MPDLVRYESCPLCSSTINSPLVSEQRLALEGHFRDQLFRCALGDTPKSMMDDITIFANAYPARLVECDNCGALSRDPRFSAGAQRQVYASDEYSEEWLESAFRQYYRTFTRRMPDLIRMVGSQAEVVEVGSYVGGFVAAATEAGWRVRGIDVGKRVSEFCRSKGLDVWTMTIEQARLPGAEFDAVFLWDCFDQLTAPRDTLNEVYRILKPGGWLFVQVPNGALVKLLEMASKTLSLPALQEYILKVLSYSGLAGFPYQTGHTRASILRLFKSHGFSNIHVKNRINVLEGGAQAPRVPPEQVGYLRLLDATANLIYTVSFHTQVLAPWIEVQARKRV